MHRDIKPSNILVGELGETMLIDWGLAKALGEPERARAPRTLAPVYEDDSDIVKTRAGVVFGTPGFMAPEQLRGKPPDERCDVYALGATLYHLLARRPPHYSKNAADMMRAAVDRPAAPLRELVPGVPPELATIVDKALAFDPRRALPRRARARRGSAALHRRPAGRVASLFAAREDRALDPTQPAHRRRRRPRRSSR